MQYVKYGLKILLANIFHWSPDLSVGNSLLDEQHKGLFALAGDLYLNEDVDLEVARKPITQLFEYASAHLSAEEVLMQQSGYRDFDLHKRLHAEFLRKLTDLSASIETAPVKTVIREIQGFVLSWLYQHVKQVDRLYVPYLVSASEAVLAQS